MRNPAAALLVILLLGYVVIASLMYIYQRDFLYFPTAQYAHAYDRFALSNQGETIEVIVLNPGNASALLYFGGNGEAVVMNAKALSSLFPDRTIYLLNYRGYGGSSGSPDELGMYADAISLYDRVSSSHDHISVIGRSLGSGVATYIAANRRVGSLVLVTPFDSILSLAKAQFPFFPVELLLKDHFNSASRAKSIDSRVLILIAEHDQVVPIRHTEKLIDAFAEDRVISKIISSAGHNSLSNSVEYHQAIQVFLQASD